MPFSQEHIFTILAMYGWQPKAMPLVDEEVVVTEV
jgi:hypothetical protein